LGDFCREPEDHRQQDQRITEKEEGVSVGEVDALAWKFRDGLVQPEAETDRK
jgi:hypothetical protein